MFDYITYLAAQERTTDESREALPDSPVLSDRESTMIWNRRTVGQVVRRLADRIDPLPDGRIPTTANSRC